MIFAVCSVLLEREGSTRLRGDTQENSERADESSNNCAAEGSEGRKGVSRPAGPIYRLTPCSCYTFAKKSSCAFPNTRCADRPNLFAWQASPAAAVAAVRGGGEESEGEGSIHFTLYVSHPIPSPAKKGSQHLERKRIHKKAAEPIPSHRTRYCRCQALHGRQNSRQAHILRTTRPHPCCKAHPMHACGNMVLYMYSIERGLCTDWGYETSPRKWNRGRNGLHQLGQPVAPSIIFPGRRFISPVCTHFRFNRSQNSSPVN